MKTRKALFALALIIGFLLGSRYPLTLWEDGSFAIGKEYPYAVTGCLPFAICND